MDIKILGTGCPNCQELERRTKAALADLNINIEVGKITDIAEIGKYTMMTPGLLINGQLKHSGKPLPKPEQIKVWLQEENKI